jgi:hypothetical protein
MPQNVVVGDKARKRAIKSLRGQILRVRKLNKPDKDALLQFAYRTGYPMKVVEEMYQLLVDAQKIPAEGTVTETTTVTA